MTAHTYSWRPGLQAPGVAHLAVDGQTRWSTPGSQFRWVWSVCAEHLDPALRAPAGAVRCMDCLSWLYQTGNERLINDMTSSEGFDLSALSEEDQARVREQLADLSGSNREFTDRDTAPGDQGTPTSN